MPVTINGNGTITGLAVGGLPDGCVDADTLAAGAAVPADGSITTAKLANGAVNQAKRTFATGEIIQTKYIERTSARANASNSSAWAEAVESQFRVTMTPTAVGNTIVAHCFIAYTAGNGTLGGFVPVWYDSVANNSYAMASSCGSSSFVDQASVLGDTGTFYEAYRNNAGSTQWFNVHTIGRYKTINTNTSTVRLYSKNSQGTFVIGDNAQACSMLVMEYHGDIDIT